MLFSACVSFIEVQYVLCSTVSMLRRMIGYPRVPSQLVSLPALPLLTRYYLVLSLLLNKLSCNWTEGREAYCLNASTTFVLIRVSVLNINLGYSFNGACYSFAERTCSSLSSPHDSFSWFDSLAACGQVVDDVLKRVFQFKREEVLQSV